MASKTQSGQAFSARTMNGIIELDDGAGTIISGGTITTTDIVADNLTTDFITANNLLEANIDETITGKWTFTQPPYITDTPTEANDAINKGYADGTFATSASLSLYITDASANATFQPIGDYITDASANATFQPIGDYITDASANATFVNKTTGLMETGYTPTTDLQVSTKLYVDSKPIGITQATADGRYVSLANVGPQFIYGTKVFSDTTNMNLLQLQTLTAANIEMTYDYQPLFSFQVATKAYVDANSGGGGGGLTNSAFFPSSSNTRLQDLTANPTTILGGYNTLIGFQSGGVQSASSSTNTHIGYKSGANFNVGVINTFLGAYSGMFSSGSTTLFNFDYTTCVGAFSYPDRNNQIVLGKSADEVKIRGTLAGTSATFDSITAGTFTITETNNGIVNVSNALNMLTGSTLNVLSGASIDVSGNGALNVNGGTTDINYLKVERGVWTYRDAGQTNMFPPIVSEMDDSAVSMRNIFGGLVPDDYGLAMRGNGEVILNGRTCVIAQANVRKIFFDFDTPYSNATRAWITTEKTLFGGKLYTFANGIYYEILSASTAYTKGEADTRYVRTANVSQSIAGTKNFTGTLQVDGPSLFYGTFRVIGAGSFDTQPYYKPASISYKLLSELDAYTKTEIDAFGFATTGDLSAYLTTASASATYQTLALMRTAYSIATNTYYSASFCNGFFFQATNIKNVLTNTATTAYSTSYVNQYFQTIANMSSYITTATADATYQTIADMVNYLTTASATATYATISSLSDYLTTASATATFATIASLNDYLTTASASATYQTIADMANYLTSATASATYQTIADMVNYQPKQPKQFTQWRYGVQTTGATTYAYWASNQVLWTTSSGITRGYDRFRYETGYNAVGENGGDTQLSTSTGYWTCVVDGMYDIEIQIQSYSTFNNLIYVDFTDTIGFLGSSLMMKTGLTFNATGQAPLANTNTFHTQIFLNAGNGFRIRTSGNGYIYTYNRNTFMIITKMTGY